MQDLLLLLCQLVGLSLRPTAGLSLCKFFLFSAQQPAFLHARSASSSSPSSRPLSMQDLLVFCSATGRARSSSSPRSSSPPNP
ncbi:hypothetical protein SLEP1_g25347 [Rubroshorea leprosula]|uniref:Secreted protein n=1 Tax=Rubroshorea leprosula TaxID=152421 RepID=A0AAV5JT22_9ROSI|nr:hypothetical protein SLEP1_g25347 [Rubroshorea leprosula]